MIILDTDHCTVLKYQSGIRALKLQKKLSQTMPAMVTIVTVEEQLRGWLASIAREKTVQRQVRSYQELGDLLNFYSGFALLPFDESSANKYEHLRTQRLRIGTMDLKIASIALVNNALLLSANLRDFQRVPGLRVENWLDSD